MKHASNQFKSTVDIKILGGTIEKGTLFCNLSPKGGEYPIMQSVLHGITMVIPKAEFQEKFERA